MICTIVSDCHQRTVDWKTLNADVQYSTVPRVTAHDPFKDFPGSESQFKSMLNTSIAHFPAATTMKLFTFFLLVASTLLELTQGEKICSATDSVYSFKFGKWDATVLKDGVIRGLESFFANVPSFAVLRNVRFYDPTSNFEASQNMLLLRNRRDVVLIDTGSGESLIRLLRVVGVAPREVTAVLLTHLHGDHSKGLLDKTGNAAFPNALVHMHRLESEFWSRPAADIGQQYPNLPFELAINETVTTLTKLKKLYAGRIRLLNDLESPIRGVTAVLTPGHTEGHTGYMLRSSGKKLMVVGDTLVSRTTVIQHPEWAIISDTNATTVVRTRYDLMDKLADEKTQVLLYHDEFPGLGFIVRDGPSFDFSTVARVA